MPDQLYVSYWLRGFTGPNMLRHFDKALRRFPFSRLKPAVGLTVYAVEISEPAVFERAWAETPQAGELVAAALRVPGFRIRYRVCIAAISGTAPELAVGRKAEVEVPLGKRRCRNAFKSG